MKLTAWDGLSWLAAMEVAEEVTEAARQYGLTTVKQYEFSVKIRQLLVHSM